MSHSFTSTGCPAPREMLASAGAGSGGLMLSSLLGESASVAAELSGWHHAAKATSVIFLFMEGDQ